jgi:hypothetical protein
MGLIFANFKSTHALDASQTRDSVPTTSEKCSRGARSASSSLREQCGGIREPVISHHWARSTRFTRHPQLRRDLVALGSCYMSDSAFAASALCWSNKRSSMEDSGRQSSRPAFRAISQRAAETADGLRRLREAVRKLWPQSKAG